MSALKPTEVFSKMLKIQVIATLVVAIIMLAFSSVNAAASAILGGVTVVVGAYVASLVAKRSSQSTEASAILVNLLKAEAVKILVIIILLFIIFKVVEQLVPFALIAGLAAAAMFSGAALSKLNV
ncbi:MAG: ATP synthase subunit I [Methylotenera sp.]|nr:ATP synthase subunit I [Methylotenera sp.]